MRPNPSHTVECRVGRLVEARLNTPRQVTEVAAFAEDLTRVFASIRGACVISADWRMSSILAPEMADAVVNLLRRGNPHFERSAVLLAPENALFCLQVERVLREAANPARRAFRDVAAWRSWLFEVLSEAERSRVDAFLASRVG